MKRSESRSLPFAELTGLWERQPCIQLAKIIPKDNNIGATKQCYANTRGGVENSKRSFEGKFMAVVDKYL